MGEYNHTESNQAPITGILSNWSIATFIHKFTSLTTKSNEQVTILIGNVDIDYKRRFPTGSWIKTSVIQHFYKTELTVQTNNSFYQLNGNGHELIADIAFFKLFMNEGLIPEQIIQYFPDLLVECVPIIAASDTCVHYTC